jgi:NADH dehydrogenase/NADH:ubiquinone oxidoreductase subunit G
VQVKSGKVMRVVPLENEDVNECWIADRDRFSIRGRQQRTAPDAPMIKQGGEWKTVDWTTALEYVANGLKQIAPKDTAWPHRCARLDAQHRRGAAPAGQAGTRAGQRQH